MKYSGPGEPTRCLTSVEPSTAASNIRRERMESKAKIMGHPIHPMLIVFPLGLLAASLGFDVGYLTTGNPEFATVSFWLISAGILGGLLSAVFGAIDWWAIPSKTRAKTIGLWHGGGNVVVVWLFIWNWWLRSQVPGYTPSSA